MKIALVYPPNMYSEAPPLGISYLKGFLLHNLADAQIRNIDLNLYPTRYKNLILGLCNYCPSASTCSYLKLSQQTIPLFSKGQEICAMRLFTNLIGQDVFLNQVDKRALRYLTNGFRDNYIALIAKVKPEVIGISLADYSQLLFGLFLAKCLKRAFAKPCLIVGGSFVNHCPAPQDILKFHFIDFCIYGDGELPLKMLLERLKKSSNSLAQVPNLIYRRGKNIIKNSRTYHKNFGEIPYPVFDQIQRYPAIPILHSFGCAYGKCTFCSYYKDGRYQQKQITNLIKEIKHQIKTYKKRNFVFWDNTITAEQLKLLSQALIKNRLNITYRAMCRPSRDFNRSILKLAFTSGCRYIFWGLESTNQRILNLMRKALSFSYAKKLFKVSYEIGINTSINIILFFPTQTKKELLADLRFLIKNYNLLGNFRFSFYYLEEGDFISRHLRRYRISQIEKIKLYSHPRYTDYGLYNHYEVKDPKVKSFNGILYYCSWSDEDSKMPKDLLQAQYFYTLGDYQKAKDYLHKYLQQSASNRTFFLVGLNDKEFISLRKKEKEFNVEESYKNVLKGFRKAITLENAKRYFDGTHFPLSTKKGIVNTANFLNRFLNLKYKKDYQYILIAYAYYNLRQYNAAIKYAHKAKKTLFAEINVYLVLGLCYERTKKYEKAIQVYKEALCFFSNEGAIYLGLAISYFNLKWYQEAIEAAKKVLELDYKEGDIHLLLGLCYQKNKQYEIAIKELKRAQKIKYPPLRGGDKFISYLRI